MSGLSGKDYKAAILFKLYQFVQFLQKTKFNQFLKIIQLAIWTFLESRRFTFRIIHYIFLYLLL